MEIADLFNADTVKLTLIPGIVVALVLFFWFRRTTPKVPPRSREAQRGRNEGGDPLMDDVDQWEVGEVRVIRQEEELQPAWQGPRIDDDLPVRDTVREPRQRIASVPPPNAGRVEVSLSSDEDSDYGDASAPLAPTDYPQQDEVARPAKAAKPAYAPAVREKSREQSAAARFNEAGLMLVLNVIVNGRQLRGAPILKAVTAAGLTYGKMGIFHYYSPSSGGRQPLFSLANMVEPGSFNLATMDEISTPGLTLFANVSNPDEGVSTFNAMLDTARKLADALHATVCDERRSTLSRQGIEHIHGRIQDFQRRSRLAHAANA